MKTFGMILSSRIPSQLLIIYFNTNEISPKLVEKSASTTYNLSSGRDTYANMCLRNTGCPTFLRQATNLKRLKISP